MLEHIGTHNIVACEAQENILKAIITDENHLYFNGYLAHNYQQRAWIYASQEEDEKAIVCLQKALAYAIATDNADKKSTVSHFTCPLLNHMEYDPKNVYRTGETAYVDDFYKFIKRKQFQKLHNREDFQKHFNS